MGAPPTTPSTGSVSWCVSASRRSTAGSIKRLAGGAKLRYQGVVRNQLWVELTAPADTLLRIAKLLSPRATYAR